jgi:hypothetical protein
MPRLATALLVVLMLACAGGDEKRALTVDAVEWQVTARKPPKRQCGLGVICGSSLTRLAVLGAPPRIFAPAHALYTEFGACELSVWADPSSRCWQVFDDVLSAYARQGCEPGFVYWMPTLWSETTGLPTPERIEQASRVYEQLRLRLPDVPVYVGPQPEHVPDGLCNVTNTLAYQMSVNLAQAIVDHPATTEAYLGPALSPITPQNNNGVEDPCHQGPVGIAEHGAILGAFGWN